MDKYDISLSILRDLEFPQEVLYVTSESSLKHREELEKLARYFKREQRTDIVQFEAEDDGNQYPYKGFLLLEHARDLMEEDEPTPFRIFGGGCFRERTQKTYQTWILDWVWVHPFFRGRGFVSKLWDDFTYEFGDFLVEPEYSLAMRKLLKSKGYEERVKVLESKGMIEKEYLHLYL